MVRIAYDKESKTEISDEGPFEVLHMHGFPSDIVPAVNKYNREHRGPDGNAINITQTCIDALKKELKKREHPRKTLTTVCNVGPVEFRRAADLIKAMGYKPLPEDIDGNKLEVGDKVGFTIAGPDANNYLQGTVCQADSVYCVDCGAPGLIRIDNDLLNLHKLHVEPVLRGRECQCIIVDEGLETPECSVCDEVADDRAQTGCVMSYTDRSIWLCPRCMTIITDLEYRHLNMLGRCTECETALVQYEKVEWRP